MLQPVQWAVGDLSAWTIELTLDNNAIADLSGVTTGQISIVIFNATKTTSSASAGVITILNATPGIIQWAPTSADVATAALYYVRVSINYGGTTPKKYDYIAWQISP